MCNILSMDLNTEINAKMEDFFFFLRKKGHNLHIRSLTHFNRKCYKQFDSVVLLSSLLTCSKATLPNFYSKSNELN